MRDSATKATVSRLQTDPTWQSVNRKRLKLLGTRFVVRMGHFEVERPEMLGHSTECQ